MNSLDTYILFKQIMFLKNIFLPGLSIENHLSIFDISKKDDFSFFKIRIENRFYDSNP